MNIPDFSKESVDPQIHKNNFHIFLQSVNRKTNYLNSYLHSFYIVKCYR
ncbi:MAG: hypothetical protein ACOCW7_01820 [Bacteroidota bacterium]